MDNSTTGSDYNLILLLTEYLNRENSRRTVEPGLDELLSRLMTLYSENMRSYIDNMRFFNENFRAYQDDMRTILNAIIDDRSTRATRQRPIPSTRQRSVHPVNFTVGNQPFFNTLQSLMQETFQNVVVSPTQEDITNAVDVFMYNPNMQLINTQCPITLENFEENDVVCRITHCGHTFRSSALQHWFRTNVRCPVCRYDIRQNSVNEPLNHEDVNEDVNEDVSEDVNEDVSESYVNEVPIRNNTSRNNRNNNTNNRSNNTNNRSNNTNNRSNNTNNRSNNTNNRSNNTNNSIFSSLASGISTILNSSELQNQIEEYSNEIINAMDASGNYTRTIEFPIYYYDR